MVKAKGKRKRIEVINAISEFEKYGIAFENTGNDEIKMLCPKPEHNDNNPSVSFNTEKNIWICHSCKGKGDIISMLAYNVNKERATILQELSTRYDLEDIKTINPQIIEGWYSNIGKAGTLLKALTDRGITNEMIRKYRLGYDERNTRITIPITDESGNILNVRKYLPGAPGPEKMRNIKGYSSIRIYPPHQFKYDKIWIVGGEMKAIVGAEYLNKHNVGVITATGGEGAWNPEWNKLFEGKEVFLCFDIDAAGKLAGNKIGTLIFSFAKSVNSIELPLDLEKYPTGDINDFIGRENGTDTQLLELQNTSEEFSPLYIDSMYGKAEANNEIEVSLADSDRPEYIGKRLHTEGIIVACDDSPFFVPKKVRVFCNREQNVCIHCPIHGTTPTSEGFVDVDIDPTNRGLLYFPNTPEKQIPECIRNCLGIPPCKSVIFRPLIKEAIREVRLQPKLELTKHETSHSVKPAFVIGAEVELNAPYNLHSVLWESPKTQQATLMVVDAERSEDSLDSFAPDKEDLDALKIFQPEEWTLDSLSDKLHDIYKDMSCNVTKIYKRQDLQTIVDITYHSALFFAFKGRNYPGWINALVIGDTAQGKSETVMGLSNHYNLGEKVECKNASVAGLLGGLMQMGSRWFVSWGKIPANDRRIALLEEVKGMSTDVISKLTDMRSSGIAELDKIERRRTSARTRLIWMSNARSDKALSSYSYGIEAITELIGASEDVRRFDIACVLDTRSVSQEDIRKADDEEYEHKYTSELCRRLILFAWTREPEEIVFENELKVRDEAVKIIDKFGSTITLVDQASIHIKIARMAVALALRTYSVTKSTANEVSVLVRNCHVEYICKLLDTVYSDEFFGYDRYAHNEKLIITIRSPELVIKHLLESKHSKDLIEFLVATSEVTDTDFHEFCGDRDSGTTLLSLLVRKGAIRRLSGYGRRYSKNAGFIDLLKELMKKGIEDKPEFVSEI